MPHDLNDAASTMGSLLVYEMRLVKLQANFSMCKLSRNYIHANLNKGHKVSALTSTQFQYADSKGLLNSLTLHTQTDMHTSYTFVTFMKIEQTYNYLLPGHNLHCLELKLY